jgi:RNA polymerase sigma factor (sigma-70 family)
MQEKEIIEKCLKADRSAQETLYNHYAPKMKGLCMRYARTNFEAEDIFQEAFIKIFKYINKYDHLGSFEGWIRRIVINTAIDHYKKNIYLGNHLTLEDVEEKDINMVEITSNLRTEELVSVINKMPEGYRIVFNLFIIDGFSHQEISKLLGISEGTSKSQLAKARKYFKKLLYEFDLLPNDHRSAGSI